jgi:hypothetical protein
MESVCGTGLASYAAMTREPISEDNLSDLKGKWEGWRTIYRLP